METDGKVNKKSTHNRNKLQLPSQVDEAESLGGTSSPASAHHQPRHGSAEHLDGTLEAVSPHNMAELEPAPQLPDPSPTEHEATDRIDRLNLEQSHPLVSDISGGGTQARAPSQDSQDDSRHAQAIAARVGRSIGARSLETIDEVEGEARLEGSSTYARQPNASEPSQSDTDPRFSELEGARPNQRAPQTSGAVVRDVPCPVAEANSASRQHDLAEPGVEENDSSGVAPVAIEADTIEMNVLQTDGTEANLARQRPELDRQTKQSDATVVQDEDVDNEENNHNNSDADTIIHHSGPRFRRWCENNLCRCLFMCYPCCWIS